jgi:hypothetical protein
MDQSLKDAAQQGNIDTLYALIQEDPYVLERIEDIPFVETPLHIAAFMGRTWFATEIMKLKPSFARKLNQNGFTPLHLALQKFNELENYPNLKRNQTQLVYRLLDVDSDLVRVQGRECVTPFHYVAQMGYLDFLTKFSEGCPKSLEDVTIRRENVLHVALKYDQVKAFQLLLGWIQRACFKGASSWESKLLRWKDEEHNTLLHVAVSKKQPEASPFHSIFSRVGIVEVYHVVQRIQSPKIVFKIFTYAFGRVIFAFIFVLGASVWMSNYVSLLVYVLQVVSLLLDRGFVDLGAKNLEGHTVFDILERQTQAKVDNQRISDMLMRLKRPSRCLAALGYCAICLDGLGYCLIFPLIPLLRQLRVKYSTQILVKCSVEIRRLQRVIKEERRNALLVIAVLLIGVTYQAALSPDKQPNEFNCTTSINATGANQYFNFTAQNPINATGANQYFNCTARFNASSGEVKPDTTGDEYVFLCFNTITFFLTNFTLFFLLPPDFLGIVLFFLLVSLSIGYCYSTPVSSAPILVAAPGLVLLLPLYFLPLLSLFMPRREHFSSDI